MKRRKKAKNSSPPTTQSSKLKYANFMKMAIALMDQIAPMSMEFMS